MRRRLFFSQRQWGRLGLRLRLLALVALLLGTVVLIDAHIRPMITSVAAYQAKVYATRAINDAIARTLSGEGVGYEELVKVSTGEDGKVSAVQTDMVRLNRLKAELTNAVTDRIASLENQVVKIPLGTLFGGQILSARGPEIEFRIVPAGYVRSELVHHFDSAGINQTRHQLSLRLDANIMAILPGYPAATEISTEVILAETVIVGITPESFTRVVTGDGRSAESLIADYGRDGVG